MKERLLTYAEAIHEATDQAMAADKSIIVMGMGVDDHRGIYGTTKGLAEKYGAARCFDTPLSEDAMTGIAIGAAMTGLRPLHVHIRMDFLLLAMNQIVNHAAKARYMYGGAARVPLVVRAIIGRSWGQGAQHSQGLHSIFAHIPGLRVVAPATPYDAKGILVRALRSDDPTLIVEHRMLYGSRSHVPEEIYPCQFGMARILRSGADITIVAISWEVVEALRAADALAKAGIEAEVIDPLSLSPLDVETITASVRKTRNLLVVDSAWLHAGMSAEIIAAVCERVVAPAPRVKRIGFAPTICPTAKNLEDLYYPNPQKIAGEAFRLVRGESEKWEPTGVDAPEIVEFRGPF